MAPPAVRASLSSVPSQRQQQNQQQHIDAAEYYGLYKTARTLARSYQAVAHQKDDQVKALTREMEDLKFKLQQMEAQQQRLATGLHGPSPSVVASGGSGQPTAPPPSRPAAAANAAAAPYSNSTGVPAAPTLTRSASLFMQAAAATATANASRTLQQQPSLNGRTSAGSASLRHSTDVNLLLAASQMRLHAAQQQQHPDATNPNHAPPSAPQMPAYPEVPMPPPVLAPAPNAAAATGIVSRSARSARASGEVWSARFSEPAHHHHQYAGATTAGSEAEAVPEEPDTATAGDAAGKSAKKASKGTIGKAFKKLMSKSWRSSRDDHPARQDADGAGAYYHPQQQAQQYARRPSGGGGAAAVGELDCYDPAAAVYEEGLMDPPPLVLPPPPPPAGAPVAFDPPPPLAAAPAGGHGCGALSMTLPSMTLPSQYLLGAPSPQDQLAALAAAQRQEAARKQQQQQQLLQQQQQQLLLLQQQQAAAAVAATRQPPPPQAAGLGQKTAQPARRRRSRSRFPRAVPYSTRARWAAPLR